MINSQITWVYCSLFLTNNCMNTLLKDTVVMFAGIFLIFFCSWLYFINNGSFVGLFCCQNHIRPTAHTHFMSLSQFDNSHHILNSYYICLVIRDQCNFPVTTVSILRNHSIDGKLKKLNVIFYCFHISLSSVLPCFWDSMIMKLDQLCIIERSCMPPGLNSELETIKLSKEGTFTGCLGWKQDLLYQSLSQLISTKEGSRKKLSTAPLSSYMIRKQKQLFC